MSEIITISQPPSVRVIAPQISVTDEPHSDSYVYPILSATSSYRDGDEGWQLANVWNSIYGDGATERVAVAELSDFYTLKTNNTFGNTSRFTKEDGTAAATDGTDFDSTGDVIYDNYLGLIFYKMDGTTVQWNNYIDNAQSVGDGSYYPVPAIIYSLINDSQTLYCNNVMQFGLSSNTHTSTTRRNSSIQNIIYGPSASFFFNFDSKTSNTRTQETAYKLI